MKLFAKYIVLLLLLAAGLRPNFCFGQDRYKDMPYDTLWRMYEEDVASYTFPTIRAHRILEALRDKANDEREAYHYFKAWTLIQKRSPEKGVVSPDFAARWGDPDSTLYYCLSNFLKGCYLSSSLSYNSPLPFHECFNHLPANVPLDSDKWAFLLQNGDLEDYPFATLNDVLLADCLPLFYGDTAEVTYLTDRALSVLRAAGNRKGIIVFELLRLQNLAPLPSLPVDSSVYWKGLDRIEATYGPDAAIDLARGLVLYLLNQVSQGATDYGARALHYFDRIIDSDAHDYYRTNATRYRSQLLTPILEIVNDNGISAPSPKQRIAISHTNIDTLYVSVFPSDENHIHGSCAIRDHEQDKYKYLEEEYRATRLFTQQFVTACHEPGRTATTELWLDSLAPGLYDIYFHLNPQLDTKGVLVMKRLRVSRMFVCSWANSTSKHLAVNDRVTGEPLKGRRATCPIAMTSFTNRFGETTVHPTKRYWDNTLTIHERNVNFPYEGRLEYPYYYRSHSFHHHSPSQYCRLYTDRTLYRPGQTVFFKFIVHKRHGLLVTNKKFNVILYSWGDDHYRDTLLVTTSHYGSASGSFQLPKGKPGTYYIDVEPCKDTYSSYSRFYCESIRLTVADYKLPTFKVELLKDTLQPTAGDTFCIRGVVTALNGEPVRDASVTLSVGNNWNAWDRVTYHTVTQNDGTFSYAHPIPVSYFMEQFHVEIEATVTDLNGETHNAKATYNGDNERLRIQLTGKNDYDLVADSTTQWLIRPENALSVKQQMPLNVTVTRLQPPAEYKVPVLPAPPSNWKPLHSLAEYHQLDPSLTFDFRQNDPAAWPVADTLYSTVLHTSSDSLLRLSLTDVPTGNYRLTVTGTDLGGKTVTATEHFTVNDHRTERFVPYQPLHSCFIAFPEQCGDKVTVTVGSCLHNAIVISDIYQGKRRLKTVRTDLDRSQHSFTVKTRKQGNRTLTVLSRIVQNGELHQHSIAELMPLSAKVATKLTKKYSKGNVEMELTSSEKTAEPGSEQEWEVSIKNGKGNPIRNAELLAWMFDGSLYHLGMKSPFPDRTSSYTWSPSPIKVSDCPSLQIKTYRDFNKRTTLGKNLFLWRYFNVQNATVSCRDAELVIAWKAPTFRADNTATATSVRGNRSDGQITMIDGMIVRGTQGVNSIDGEISSVRGARPEVKDEMETALHGIDAHAPKLPDIRLRSNFTETAFFYPQLYPGENGTVRFRFTLPDQYTQWEFFGYAHTKGTVHRMLRFHTTLQSRLTLMLQSNAPRFFRERDTLELQVKITSLCDTALNGTANAAFYDPETSEPLTILSDAADSVRPFRCEAGGSTTVAWRIVIPEGTTSIGYRLTARAGSFGDGEEKVLPVLPNRTLVTETMNFIVPARTDTTLIFESYRDFTKKLTFRSSLPLPTPLAYTAEFTTNPTWLALYALPDLITYPYECNEQVFSKLFAAATVLHALEKTPGMDSLLQSWRDDTLAAISPLLANKELKEMLLEETPWLRNAQSEEHQRQAIADLFQIDNLNKVLQKNLNKLTQNQLAHGGWSWYGHYSYSGFITAHIAAGLYKLIRIGAAVPSAEKMAAKALRRMDKEHEEAYRQYLQDKLEKPDLAYPFREEDAHYLYARSFVPMDSSWLSTPYVQNLIQLATKDLLHCNYTRQAEMALFLYRSGRTREATEIITSLRREAVRNPETGMYWRSEYSGRYYFHWYEAPIERQAILIEAFAEISPRADELADMKLWLLQNKKTHSWYSTKATTEAVYALLLDAPENLLAPSATTISVGSTPLLSEKTGSAYGGSGYLKQTWTPTEITPELADISIRTDSTHAVFGACYWQYTEIPENVAPAGRGLTVQRTLYHQEKDNFGKPVPVTAKNPVRLGEKLTVHLELTSDRELEYVHVKDPRAAAFEPVNFRENWHYDQRCSWTETPRDAATHFFISRLPEGKTVIEYDVFATQTGGFSYGCATVECMYAPEHCAQSAGERIDVKAKGQ